MDVYQNWPERRIKGIYRDYSPSPHRGEAFLAVSRCSWEPAGGGTIELRRDGDELFIAYEIGGRIGEAVFFDATDGELHAKFAREEGDSLLLILTEAATAFRRHLRTLRVTRGRNYNHP